MLRDTLSGSRDLRLCYEGYIVELGEVPFRGWIEHDRGDDVTGPSFEGEVWCEWTQEDLVAVLSEQFDDVDDHTPDWVFAESGAALEHINEKLNALVFSEPVLQYIDVR